MTDQYKDPAMTGSGMERLAHDAYFTIDTWTITSFIPILKKVVTSNRVWEPACGAGHISKELVSEGFQVWSSDLNAWGYGHVQDFLTTPVPEVDARIWNIMTNPPYEKEICEAFVAKALEHIAGTSNVAAFLMRHEWDTAGGRKKFFGNNPMFFKKVVLTRRPKWFTDVKASPRFSYAWYMWKGDHEAEPTISYAP